MLATSNISTGTEGQAWMKPPMPTASQNLGTESSKTSQAGAIPVVDGKVQYNPVLNYDRSAQVVLVQIVDPATGEVERQYPSEKQVEAYQKAMEEQKSSMPEIEGSSGEIPAGNRPDATEVEGEVAKTISTMDRDSGQDEGLSLVA